jgi:UDP-N-acetyl-D-mannosaminuronic acid dehydrogenase
MLDELLEKTKSGRINVCVLGLGRVGLPFAAVLAKKGIKVFGIDINEKVIESIRNKKSPFFDPNVEKLLESNSMINFQVFSSVAKINERIDIFIITVGTPVLENNIDYSQLYSALNELSSFDLQDTLIILRSTMPPKTTSDIVLPFLELKTSLKPGKDFALAVCPERILEGKAVEELEKLPEIIGGINKISESISVELFLKFNSNKEMLFTTPTGAELSKLFANIFRYTNFALANEYAIWAEKYDLDASELIKIVNHNYSRSNIPVPGFVGGPCLTKDGIFLDNNTTFLSMISTIWKLNESIPQHVVNTIRNEYGNLFNKKISILGISFKKNSDDIRNSPSLKLVNILKSAGADVLIHDPHVQDTSSLDDALRSTEIVIIATNHDEFQNISDKIRQSNCKVVYDVWSMFSKSDFPIPKYLKLGSIL